MKGRKVALVLSIALAGAAGHSAAQDSMTTVAMAASRNETAQVKALLDDKLNDPDIIDGWSGRTALDFAASFDNLTMAQLLLNRGAHVDWRDTMGDSALHYAAERGNLDFIRFLIAHGATVDFPNKQGITPIMVAADHAQPAAVRLLLKSGADPKRLDFTGRDAYGWATGKPAVVQALNAAR